MRKVDIAGYLVSLNALMEAQSKSVKATVSPILAAEYNLHWEMLKQKIMEEYNETGSRSVEHDGINKDGTDVQSSKSGKS